MNTFASSSLDHQLVPLLWIAASLLLYMVGSHLAWLAQKPRLRPWRRLVHRWRNGQLKSLLHGALRLVFYLGVPYMALLRGVIQPRSVGLVTTVEGDAARWAVGIAVGALILWAMIWRGYAAALPPKLVSGMSPGLLKRARTMATFWGWPFLLLDVLCLEAHWAFYRSGPLLLVGDWYAGVAIGTALVLLEGYSNPAIRCGLRRPGQAEGILLAAAIAVVMATVFLYTRSFWVSVAVHFLLEMALLSLWRLLGGPRTYQVDQSSSSISAQRTG